MWEAWTLAKQLRSKPSEIYNVRDELAAFCFDRAVTTFGLAVENDIHEGTQDAKDQADGTRKASMILDRWLREPGRELDSKKFRDPFQKG